MLSSNQIKKYNEEGFVSPIDIFSTTEALELRKEIEKIEKEIPNEVNSSGRYNLHLISPLLDQICHNPNILDAVESVIGENILVCGTTLFIKEPNEKGFVSYHQDAKYIGLEPHNWVTAWVAVTDANIKNGCMNMWAGSHKDKLKYHSENFDDGNLLTRGQTVENVPKDQIKPIELNAGQMSLHHPKTVHGSGLNKSNDRRIGFVIQSYIGTNVKQVIGKNGVQLARGEDKFNFHKHINRPKSFMNEDDNQQRIIENQNLREIFYSGSNKKGKF